jgi:hypothetical protein
MHLMDLSSHHTIWTTMDVPGKANACAYSLLAIVLTYMVYHCCRSSHQCSNFPTINYDPKAWTYASAKTQFRTNCKQLLLEGSRKACILPHSTDLCFVNPSK